MKGFLTFVLGELRWRVALAALASIALALAEGAGLMLLVPLLGSIGLAAGDGPTGGLASAVGAIFAAIGLRPSLPVVLGVFLIVSTAHAFLYRATVLINPALEQRVALTLQTRLFASMSRAHWTFFLARRGNDLVHALTRDIDRAAAVAYQLLTLFTGVAVSTVYIALSFWLSPALTTLIVLAGGGVLWGMRRRTRQSSEMGERYRAADSRAFHTASESVAGIKIAKSLGAEDRGTAVYTGHAQARAGAYLELVRSIAGAKLRLDLTSAVLISAFLIVAVEWLDVRGSTLLLLVFAFVRVMPRLVAFQASTQVVMAGLPSYAGVRRLIDDAEAHAEHLGNAPLRPLHIQHGVSLEDVSYTYNGSERPALRGLSLHIPAGRITAIVGASGAGKSTVADMLLGLLRPAGGRLLLDGRPLAEGDLPSWRRGTGYVPQDSFFLHDTVRANLLWAVPAATDDEMWQALERASATSFLRNQRDGLDTIIGDRGVRLSGGERQRLALARALLVRPQLLVLDEATSALDSPNEQQILAAVHEQTGPLTTVVITHRLSAIRGADVIHVLEDGQLMESGTWNELARQGSAFARLLQDQPDQTHALIHSAAG